MIEIRIGQIFGALKTIEIAPKIGQFLAWLCQCECGNTLVIKSASLYSGKSQSCGCRIHHFPNHDPKLRSALSVYRSKYSDGNLTFAQFCSLSKLDCFYCGAKPDKINVHSTPCRIERRARPNQFEGEKGAYVYNGLDRVDPYKKHDLNNVIPCCKHCNRAKLQMSIDDFHSWVQRISKHWGSKEVDWKPELPFMNECETLLKQITMIENEEWDEENLEVYRGSDKPLLYYVFEDENLYISKEPNGKSIESIEAYDKEYEKEQEETDQKLEVIIKEFNSGKPSRWRLQLLSNPETIANKLETDLSSNPKDNISNLSIDLLTNPTKIAD